MSLLPILFVSAKCKRSMEVAGWKKARTKDPQPDIPVLFFFSDGICERQFVSPLAFSRALTVTQKTLRIKQLGDDFGLGEILEPFVDTVVCFTVTHYANTYTAQKLGP